jgi:signal transduction histidine kinase
MLKLGAFLGAAALCITVAAQTSPDSPQAPWRVVLLHNADFLLPASTIMDQPLRQTLVKEARRQVDVYGETLDLLRFPQAIDSELVALQRKKYGGAKVDLILARASGGLDFAVRHRDELWPGVPIVFYNVTADSLATGGRPSNSTGLLIDIDPAGTIELARRMHPDARQLYLVGGTAEYDRSWKRRIDAILKRSPGVIPVTWLDDLPLPGLLAKVSALAPGSIVLFTSMIRDAQGLPQDNPKVAGLVAKAANAPVYGFLDPYIGQGIVGGAIADFAGQGTAAARLALRILDGESAAATPIQPSPPARCIVDARAMERWKIARDRLPAGCEVRFRTPSVWRGYRWYVLGALLALMLQSVLIASLVFQRRRRRLAEIEAAHRRTELQRASRLALAGQLTASIAHEINQPLGAILVNTGTAKALLESVPPKLDEVRDILTEIHKEDLRASQVIRRVRALLTKGDVERQWVDVNALVAETISLLDAETQRRDVVIEAALATGLPSARVDRTQLQQALLNLCINGMDAMVDTPPDRRRLEVSTVAHDDGACEIAIADRGSGIQPRELPQLFDSFFTTKPHGMGLGLSITRAIVEAHGGALSGENRVDGGALFRVLLPGADAENPPAWTGRNQLLSRTAQ